VTSALAICRTVRLSTVSIAVVLACAFTVEPFAQSDDHAASGIYNKSLGVECGHCHTGTEFADASKPTFDFARRMERMVRGLNEGPLKPLGGISCWSCHRGHATPSRIPRADWESIVTAHAADFAGKRDGLGLAMGVYAASLGVDCSHCHVPGDWADGTKPAHETVTLMSSIFDLIPTYFDPAVRMPRTQCYMCHQGHVRVERVVR